MPSKSNHDREILEREAHAINAEVDWSHSPRATDITVKAPSGFVWASTDDSTLNVFLEKPDPSLVREAVEDMLKDMEQGFKPLVMEDEYDPSEYSELDFDY